MTALDRREVVRRLLDQRLGMIVVGGLGAPAYDVAAAGDRPLDFPLWGAMGGAAMVGLGLAIAQPDRTVLVLTGDGEMLMGLGSLATIGSQRPPNLRIVVLDNERFGETGNQPTHTAWGTDLASVAAACGITDTRTVRDPGQIDSLRRDIHQTRATLFAAVKIAAGDQPPAVPPRDGPFLAHRLRAALLGEDRALDDR